MSGKAKFNDAQIEILLDVLRRARKKYDKQEDLALALGITQPSLSAILGGRWKPGLTTAKAIAQLGGTTLDELLEDTGWVTPTVEPSRVFYNMVTCVEFHRGVKEWKPWTLAAARAGFWGEDDFPAASWAAKLDALEAAMEKARK